MRRKVTIEDIAHKANASITTVSMVLRDKPGIGAETRQRVLAVARELGYQRRTPADNTIIHTVAMILRSRTGSHHEQWPSVNPFYSEVITGIETTARAQRMNLLYATLPVDQANRPYEIPKHLLDQPLAGVLLIGSFSAETVAAIADVRSTPTVLVDAPAQPSMHDAVVSNNESGAYDAVRYLIDHGHRHIALVGTDLDADPNFSQRRNGYLRALHDHGLSPTLITTDRTGMHAVREATTSVLRDQPEITALFGANDASAIEGIRGAEQAQRHVPADLSVIGFDDIALAGQIAPKLTTMAVDRITMGRQAVQMLQHRLAWPGACRLMTVLRPELQVRDSVASVSHHDDVADPANALTSESG